MKLVAGQVYDFVAKFPPFCQHSLIITKVTKYSVYCIWSDGGGNMNWCKNKQKCKYCNKPRV